MSRSLRNKQRAPIIEVSDSEDDVKPAVEQEDDSDFEIEEEIVENDRRRKPESTGAPRRIMRKALRDGKWKELGATSGLQEIEKNIYISSDEEAQPKIEKDESDESTWEVQSAVKEDESDVDMKTNRRVVRTKSKSSRKVAPNVKLEEHGAASGLHESSETEVVGISSDEEASPKIKMARKRKQKEPNFKVAEKHRKMVWTEESTDDSDTADIVEVDLAEEDIKNEPSSCTDAEGAESEDNAAKPALKEEESDVEGETVGSAARTETESFGVKLEESNGWKGADRETIKSEVVEIYSDEEAMPKMERGELKVENEEDSKPSSKKRKQKEPTAKIAAKRKRAVKTKKNADETDIADSDDENVKNERTKDEENKFEPSGNAKECVEWSEAEYISEVNDIDRRTAENIANLLKDDNTIPFIARYRKEMTGRMEPEQLRAIKESYDRCKQIKQRAATIIKTIDKLGKWSPEIHTAVSAAKSLAELDHIYAPYKSGSKRSLAERAKELGLGAISEAVVAGLPLPALSSLINPSTQGLKTEDQIRNGVMHIVAETMSKDKATFEKIRELRKATFITIETQQSKSSRPSKTGRERREADENKYENYFNFRSSEKSIKAHQILAINRGEAQKVLSVKIGIPDWFMHRLKHHCMQRRGVAARASWLHCRLLEDSFSDAYNRLIKPLVARQVRHDMNERAERASIEVFASNLKRLLLTPPFRGKTVLGVDPGFSHGCKLAVVSEQGNVLDTATIYPHTKSGANGVQTIVNLVRRYNCTTLALGNATACRETEALITGLIQSGAFAPLDVSYTIINEAGASVYSCSPEAKSEFPNLDPNLISAVSIARRLQDPLAELVKVDPKHLGVGMYQHDLPEKQLQLTLNEVISETVSFVGVDINTASHCLLRRVAGLNAARATSIIDHRNRSGPFKSRKQLMEVKGIGKKSFEQCAGFIRILPETALAADEPGRSKNPLNPLDQTWIHPESYDVARKFLAACKCSISDIGLKGFISKVISYAGAGCRNLAQELGSSEATVEIIVKALSMEKGEDIRVKEEAPLFRRNLKSIEDLSVGVKLSGLVRNVTHFGAFVDIGVGRDGLIPAGRMRGQKVNLGQRVEIEVISVEKDRNRIALDLLATL